MAKVLNWPGFELGLKHNKQYLFSASDVQQLFGVSKVAASFFLHRYVKRDYIVHIRRNMYALRDALPPEFYLANKLYEPSYISLEFALSYHSIIPETVYEITSVTTNTTHRFEVLGKAYMYRKIKKECFTGYVILKQKALSFRIADPEKAFVDTNYFRFLTNANPVVRFDKAKLDPQKALKYASLFNNPRFNSIIKTTLS